MELKAVAPAASREDNHVVPAQVNSVVPYAQLLREAIDEAGTKHDAVAAALGVGPSYLSKMLAGEKAITDRLIQKLPDDIESIYARKVAEAFGHDVLEKLSGENARRAFASGLIGMLRERIA